MLRTTRLRLALAPVVDSSLSAGNSSVLMKASSASPGDAFGVGGLGAPLQGLWNGRAVVVLHDFELLILIIDDLQKKHPAELGETLGIAVDADVLPYNVLNRFDAVSDGHGSGTLLINGGL